MQGVVSISYGTRLLIAGEGAFVIAHMSRAVILGHVWSIEISSHTIPK